MRRIFITSAVLAAQVVGVAADDLILRPGASALFTLAENPSTGYSWRVDAGASSGLDILAISDGGHAAGASKPGAPGTHRWTIRALKDGTATVVFAYQRPWEPAAVETTRLTVKIAR